MRLMSLGANSDVKAGTRVASPADCGGPMPRASAWRGDQTGGMAKEHQHE